MDSELFQVIICINFTIQYVLKNVVQAEMVSLLAQT